MARKAIDDGIGREQSDGDSDTGRGVRGHLRELLRGVARHGGLTPVLFAIYFMVGRAAAQSASGTASTICGTGGYTFLMSLVYVIMGLSLLAILGGLFAGAGLKSFGWVGRTVNSIANEGIVYSLGGLVILILALAILGVGSGYLTVSVPQACYFPF